MLDVGTLKFLDKNAGELYIQTHFNLVATQEN